MQIDRTASSCPSSVGTGRPAVRLTASPSVASSSPEAAGASRRGAADTLTVSCTARALDTALATAKKALDDMPDKELRELVKRTQRDVSLNESLAVPGALGKEVPDSTDEARLDIAHRATAFVRHLVSPSWSPDKDPLNPFYGMSRSDLAAIQYDQTGRFTHDERRAAASEAGRQYGEWSAQVCERAASERARTGKTVNFLREVLAYYEALPAVERAALPAGHLANLRLKVAAADDGKGMTWQDFITDLLSSHGTTGPSRSAKG
jgi:hypothetical protein